MTMTPNLANFLSLIRWSEGTSTSPITINKGYDIIVSGPDGPEAFTDYSQHPFEHRAAKVVRPGLLSTAAGGYQFLVHIWDAYRHTLKLPDFSPASQDAAALQIISERHALPLIANGLIPTAIQACSNIWASLPGNGYGQGGHSMDTLMAQWEVRNTNDSEAA
jgi:muramidase (phage lysozyme)